MPKVTVYPHGRERFPGGPPTVAIKHRGCEILLMFAAGDVRGEGDVAEMRILPDTEQLEPRVLRRFAPHADLYLKSAREALQWQTTDLGASIEALRQIGRPGRGLTDDFYKAIAKSYTALVDEGERHPIKTLGEIHNATISAASRWVKEARRRGLIPEKGRET